MKLKLSKWDPSAIKPYRIILIIGRRGTGKSTLLEDLLYQMRSNVDFAVAMSPTEESLNMFRQHMPESWLYPGYTPGKVEDMVEMQKALSRCNKHRSLLLTLDDCLYEKSVLRSTCMRQLFFNGRHLRICLIFAVQYLVDVDPSLRTQIDYVISLREGILSNKNRLHRFFYGIVPNFQDFCNVLDKVTDNYGALVLDATCTSTKLEDCLYWYRANIKLPPFKIGKPVFWKLASKYGRTEDEMERMRSERSALSRAKRGGNSVETVRVTQIERKDKKGRTIDEDRDDHIVVVG